MPRLALSLLGPLEITVGGNPVTGFESDKVRALLAYLAVESDRPHRRERLTGLLWPDRTESNARQNLSRALFNLRRAIGDRDAQPPFLLITPQTLQFNRSSDHWLDVTAFTALLAACEAHHHRRPEACGPCADRLWQAVALYRGAFLEEFSLDDSPAFEEWVLLEQERLRRLALDALRRLADRHERRGEVEQTLKYARRQVEVEPWQEKAHRQAMRALALSGRRSEALAQYEACRRALEKELGVEPEEETTALYDRIRDRDRDRGGEGLQALSTAPPHNLPASLTSFVGRAAELAEIQDRLQDQDCRLLTLVGPGGIGKTRLALEAGRAQRGDFDHGVFFVSLAALQSVESIAPTVAKAIGFSFSKKGEPDRQLLDYLRHKEMLLVLDNFEHLLSGAGVVTDVLEAAPGVTILATSRARLSVQGEHLFPVVGMAVPESSPETAAEAARYDAVELFLTGARQARPGFELTEKELTDVVRVCQLVQGMPLGIMLAAAWMGVLPPAEIAAQIRQSLDILEADLRDAPQRQQSIRAAFDHSWNLLSERERQVFRALSVFCGGFTREAAQAIAGASLQELRRLVNQSLLYRAPADRYEIHELLRQYAGDKLEALGERDAVRNAHSAYYAGFLDQRLADLQGRRQLGALDEIDADFENVRAAWNWALECKDNGIIGQSLRSLGWFCQCRSRNQEFAKFLQRAQKSLTPGPDEEPHLTWGRILMAEFYASFHQVGRVQLEQGLAIAQRYGDQRLIATGLRALGEAVSDAGNYAEALSFYQESLVIFRDIGFAFDIAETECKLAEMYRLSGRSEEAIQLARQSLGLSREIGDRFWAARSLANTGTIALYTGNYTEAEGYLREANTIYREMGHMEGIASVNVDLSKLAHIRGEQDEGKALAEKALEIATDIGSKRVAQSARSLLREERDDHIDEREPVPLAEISTTIGRFKVKRLLGAGPWNAVCLAYDPDSGRDVVVKILDPKSIKKYDLALQLFKREAEIMAKLAQHPSFPEFCDFVETADHAYIVMEFIKGRDLEDILEEQKGFLSEKDVIEWAVQMCDGLIHMHNQRPAPLIFRDLKPANVMVEPDGKVRLVDLGITEVYHAGREQVAIGTKGYAPLEQYYGYTDARSDVYALGATLHHLLTRRDPRKEKAFTFHDAPPRSLNPAISENLEAVILKAAEHNPEDRYQSIEEIKAALLACL